LHLHVPVPILRFLLGLRRHNIFFVVDHRGEAPLSHTLSQKKRAFLTRLRAMRVHRNARHKERAPFQQRQVAQFFDDVFLSVNRPIGIATAFGSRADTIRRNGQDFIALHQDGTMQLRLVRLVIRVQGLPNGLDLLGQFHGLRVIFSMGTEMIFLEPTHTFLIQMSLEDITVVLTACARPDLLQITLKSF